jgi:hypothetical protein
VQIVERVKINNYDDGLFTNIALLVVVLVNVRAILRIYASVARRKEKRR